MAATLLVGAGQLVGLLLIPFGVPGAWIQLAALALFAWTTGFAQVGAAPLLILLAVALSAELVDASLDIDQVDTRFRRRLGIAGLVGGGAGAALGLPFPLLGSVFGTFVGALTGALLAVLFGTRPERIGCAALLGRVIGTTMRTSAGVIIAVFSLLTLIR